MFFCLFNFVVAAMMAEFSNVQQDSLVQVAEMEKTIKAMRVTDFFGWTLVSAQRPPKQPPDPGDDWWSRTFRQPTSLHRALTRWAVRQAKLLRTKSIDTSTLTLKRRLVALLGSVVRWLSAGIVEVRAFSHAFLIGVPGGAAEEEQAQWMLPVQSQALLYGTRHLAVILLLARHQRLHDLAVTARARAKAQATRAAQRRQRALDRLASALPAIMNSVRTFHANSTGVLRRPAGGGGRGWRRKAARVAPSTIAASEVLQSTVSFTMQHVIDRTHGTARSVPGHAGASSQQGPVAEALTSTTFEKRRSDELRTGSCRDERGEVAASDAAAGDTRSPDVHLQGTAAEDHHEAAGGDAYTTLSGLLVMLHSGGLPAAAAAAPTLLLETGSSVERFAEVSLGEEAAAEVAAMSGQALVQLPLPHSPDALPPVASEPTSESIWTRFERCRQRMRAALRTLPQEARQQGSSLELLQRQLRRFPLAFRTAALEAALEGDCSWQHQAGLRLLLHDGIYGIVPMLDRNQAKRNDTHHADTPKSGPTQAAPQGRGASTSSGLGSPAAQASCPRAKLSPWAKLKGSDSGGADGESAHKPATKAGWGAIRGAPGVPAQAADGEGAAWKRGWGQLAAGSPGASLSQRFKGADLLKVIQSSRTDPALLAQKPFEGAWAQLEVVYLAQLHARLQKKAERVMLKLQHLSGEQRELRRQTTLAPEQRRRVQGGIAAWWQAWLSRLFDSGPYGGSAAPWRVRARNVGVDVGTDESTMLLDGDQVLQTRMGALESRKRALLRHAAHTLAAQNRFAAAATRQVERRPTMSLSSVAASAVTAAKAPSGSWAALAARASGRSTAAAPSSDQRGPQASQASRGKVAAAPGATTAPADPAQPGLSRTASRWRATAKQVVPAVGPGEFRGLASFHMRAELVPSARSPSLMERALTAGRVASGVRGAVLQNDEGGAQQQQGRWRLAYRWMQGRPRVVSAQAVAGGRSSDAGAETSARLAEIERHALALLLRVPSRGELQLQQDVALVQGSGEAAARPEGAGAGPAGGRSSMGARGVSWGSASGRTVGGGAGGVRWSAVAAAVGEGMEAPDVAAADGSQRSTEGAAVETKDVDETSSTSAPGNADAGRYQGATPETAVCGASPKGTGGAAAAPWARQVGQVQGGRRGLQAERGTNVDADGSASAGGDDMASAAAARAWGARCGRIEGPGKDTAGAELAGGSPLVAPGMQMPVRVQWQRAKGLAAPAPEEGNKQVSLAPKLRLKLHDVVTQAREHLTHNRVRLSFRGGSKDADEDGEGGGTDEVQEQSALFTDDLLGTILANRELCDHLGLQPAETVCRMQLYEGLAINFMYDMGARSNKVALHREWKNYALAQDFMSAEAFAAREHLNQYHKVTMEHHLAGPRSKEEEQAIAELAATDARKEALEHIQETRAGLDAFLSEAADAVKVRLPCANAVLYRSLDKLQKHGGG
eukprot:jgi/Ulvmu1/12383/UM009_0029.1